MVLSIQEFTGNTDKTSVVRRDLDPPITARYIRFRPMAWYSHISMRVELYGCKGIAHYFLFKRLKKSLQSKIIWALIMLTLRCTTPPWYKGGGG